MVGPPRLGALPAQSFGEHDLAGIRRAVVAHAAGHGLSAQRCTDVAIVISELTGNSVVHGGGWGTIRSWTEGPCVVHEVSDRGHITDPDAGRMLPPPDQPGGRGLWLVAQLSDRVERVSNPQGTTTTVALGPR